MSKQVIRLLFCHLAHVSKNPWKAAEALDSLGLSTTVADARFCKPLDQDLIRDLVEKHSLLITVEEGAVGGFGSHVMQFLAMNGLLDKGIKVRPICMADSYIDQGKPNAMYDEAGVNAPQIISTALEALDIKEDKAKNISSL